MDIKSAWKSTLGMAGMVVVVVAAGLQGSVADAASAVPPIVPSENVISVSCSSNFLVTSGDNSVASLLPRTKCYRLVVPQDRANPGAALTPVSLAIAVIEPKDGASEPTPLLALAGGNGLAVPRLMSQFFGDPVRKVAQVERLSPGHRVILVDYRGAGLSTPATRCPGVGFSNSHRFPTSASVSSCRASLAAQGVDLQHFTAPRFAEDLVQVRQEFGIPQWDVFGLSLGSTVGLELLRVDGSAIRSIALDGVSPPTQSGFAPAYRVNPILETFDECAADSACAAAYPHLDTQFASALTALPNDPAFPDSRSLSRQRFGSALRIAVEYPGLRGRIPSVVSAAARGDFRPFAPLARAYDNWYPITTSDSDIFVGPLNGLSYFCTHEATPERLATIGQKQTYRPVAPVVLESVITDMPEIPGVCAGLGIPQGPGVEITPVHSDVPAVLLNGVNDTSTPPFWAEDAASTLSNSGLVLFEGTGHTTTIERFDCASQVIAGFYATLDTAAAPPCVRALESTTWKLPNN